MKKQFRTIAEVLASPLAAKVPTLGERTDRVLKSTKLEDLIYSDLRNDDAEMDALETEGSQKLRTFASLSRDVYQSFYSFLPKQVEPEHLSPTAEKFNAKILSHVTEQEDFPTLKSICEGRDLPAYEASCEFVSRTADELDDLLSDIGGDKGAMNTLEKLEQAQSDAERDLSGLLERIAKAKVPNPTLEQMAVDTANTADSKGRQVVAVGKMIDTKIAQNKAEFSDFVASATSAAKDRAQEVQDIIGAWSDEPGNMERNEVNQELLKTVRKSPILKDISKYLGRFREIFAQGKKNGYAYGRGEKYALELGRDLSRAITSEMSMLATEQTAPLFLQKYQRGQIKQYQRREPIYKGAGDIICCLDESGSTRGDAQAWGKAVAMTLLEIANDGGRKFALIHFSGSGSFLTHIFLPTAYTSEQKLQAAECFLDGGTDYQTPLQEAMRLMTNEGFEQADIVFLTDGECALPKAFVEHLHQEQAQRQFKVTGILLDKGQGGMDFSLKPFCQNIYRTSELMGDEIVRELVSQRI